MNTHYTLSDIEFEKQFTDCSIDPSIFSHEAHLRLAWLYIKTYGLEQAEEKIQIQLQNFVTAVGAIDKYNTTLTVSAIRAVAHFMEISETDNFKEFITEYPQLKNDFKELISKHYSIDIFNSIEAKASFIPPDLESFVEIS